MFVARKSHLSPLPLSYDVFADCEVLVDEETGPILRVCVENHFESVKILRGEKSQKRSKHRQPLLSRRSASLRSSLPPDTTPLDHVDSGEDIVNAPRFLEARLLLFCVSFYPNPYISSFPALFLFFVPRSFLHACIYSSSCLHFLLLVFIFY